MKERNLLAQRNVKAFINWDGWGFLSTGQQLYLRRKIFNSFRSTGDWCCNNYRICFGDWRFNTEYAQIRDNGCCGFFDTVVEFNKLILLKRTQKVSFGFNFGH